MKTPYLSLLTELPRRAGRVLLYALFLMPLAATAARAEPPRGNAETVWKSGDEFVKLVPQDVLSGVSTPLNQHPVTLRSEEIAAALTKISFRRDDESVAMMDRNAAAALAPHLARALGRASPGQDILFAIQIWVKARILGSNDVTIAARAFHFGGKLHLIVGDLHRSTVPPEFKYSPLGNREIDRRLHPHEPGMRPRETPHKNVRFETVPGIQLFTLGERTREDWLVLDLAALAAPAARAPSEGERASTPAPEKATTAEERLTRLKRLHNQGLITDEEFARKRKEIIDQL